MAFYSFYCFQDAGLKSLTNQLRARKSSNSIILFHTNSHQLAILFLHHVFLQTENAIGIG